MSGMTYSITSTTAIAHNGPICQTCARPYVGSHKCSVEDLLRRAEEFQELARRRFDELLAASTPVDLDVRLKRRES